MNTKLHKSALMFFFLLIVGLSSVHFRQKEEIKEIKAQFHIEKQYPSFVLPSRKGTFQNRQKLIEKLSALAKEFEVELIARSTSYTIEPRKNEESSNLYFFTTDKKHSILEKRFKNSSKKIFGKHGTVNFILEDFQQANSLDVATFFVLTKEKVEFNKFLEKLKIDYEQVTGETYPINSFQTIEKEEVNLEANSSFSQSLTLSIFFLSVFSIAWLYCESKKVGLYTLHGLSVGQQFSKIVFTKGMSVLYLLAVMLEVGILQMYALNYFIYLIVFILGYLGILYVALLILFHLSTVNQLNHKSYDKKLAFLEHGVKFVILFTLIPTLFPLIDNARKVKNSIELSNKNEEYAVFYPISIGKETMLLQKPEENFFYESLAFKIYDKMNQNGGLYFFSHDYYNQNDELSKTLVVNPNYLKKFPIETVTGKKVNISDDETSVVLLVPEKFSSKLEEIKQYYNSESLKEIRSLYSNTEFGNEEPKLEIYLIKNEQRLSGFDKKPLITHPNLILVQTEKNKQFLLPNFLSGNSFETSMKIKLNGSVEKTYQEYLPILKEIEREDTYTSLVPLNKLDDFLLKETIGNIREYVQEKALAVYLILSLIISSTMFYFQQKKKKFVIKRIHGISLYKTYQTLFLLTLSEYCLLFLSVLYYKEKVNAMIAVSVFFVIEILVVLLTLMCMEKRSMDETLKGK